MIGQGLALASNVPAWTANDFAFTMLFIVAIFLISGPSITYYYLKKFRKMREPSAGSQAGNANT